MHRLGGEDAGFLFMELPTQPINSMGVAILRPGTGPDGKPAPVTLEEARTHMARRMGVLPAYRWRIQRVPLGIGHPVWVDDPDFDIGYHVRHHQLPAPGTPAQFDAYCAGLTEQRLDRRHPLWQLVLVDGLEDGRQALVLRYSHALADGVAAVTTLNRMFTGRDHEPEVPAEPWVPAPLPGRGRLLLDALRDRLRLMAKLPRLILGAIRSQQAMRRYRASGNDEVPTGTGQAPACSLNNAYTVGRRYSRIALPLSEIRAVKDAAGVSVNDVALAVVAGALRSYLLARDELPAGPLLASVPVSTEPADAPVRQWGNRFSGMTTSLATDIADPWTRLETISRITKEAKAVFDISGAADMPDLLDQIPPFLAEWVAHGIYDSLAKGKKKPDVNIVVSNIRGSSKPWKFDTASVEEFYAQGPPCNGVGSNILVWSHLDQLSFGTISFADSLDSSEDLTTGLRLALTELVEAAASRAGVAAEDKSA